MYDVIILGSGPAGLSAAIYAQRARLSALIIEEKPLSGGQILDTYEVDNYPGLPGITGFEMGQKFRAHADKLGAEVVNAQVLEVKVEGEKKVVSTAKGDYEAKSLIIATGARHRKLGVPGEDKLVGMGVSYCATCDGAFFRGKSVAVAGGGDVALEDALFLARGCEKVYLIHRRDTFRGEQATVKRLLAKDNVEFFMECVPCEILGDAKVSGLKIRNVKTEEETQLPVEGVFVAIGQMPDNEAFADVAPLDDHGYIAAGEDCLTATPGIFVCGDCRTKAVRQLATAAADGAVAALAAAAYINGTDTQA